MSYHGRLFFVTVTCFSSHTPLIMSHRLHQESRLQITHVHPPCDFIAYFGGHLHGVVALHCFLHSFFHVMHIIFSSVADGQARVQPEACDADMHKITAFDSNTEQRKRVFCRIMFCQINHDGKKLENVVRHSLRYVRGKPRVHMWRVLVQGVIHSDNFLYEKRNLHVRNKLFVLHILHPKMVPAREQCL